MRTHTFFLNDVETRNRILFVQPLDGDLHAIRHRGWGSGKKRSCHSGWHPHLIVLTEMHHSVCGDPIITNYDLGMEFTYYRTVKIHSIKYTFKQKVVDDINNEIQMSGITTGITGHTSREAAVVFQTIQHLQKNGFKKRYAKLIAELQNLSHLRGPGMVLRRYYLGKMMIETAMADYLDTETLRLK